MSPALASLVDSCSIAIGIMERRRKLRIAMHIFNARRALRIARIAKESNMPVDLVQWLVTADRERELARAHRRVVVS
jgi:predicted transcriptional regulator